MKNNLLVIISFFFCCICFSQEKVTWKTLAQVEFSDKFFPAYGESFLYPQFSSAIQSLEGKKVTIIGYFLNIDPQEKLYILSKGPMSSCFFCGVGGPETAIELQFASKQTFKTDAIVAVTGTLVLNADDIQHFNYILKGCKVQLVH